MIEGDDSIKELAKPKLILSRCIEHDHCRYDGSTISSPFVKELEQYVEFQTICPEVEIGLGIPRKPIRIREKNKDLRLVQPETGRDITEEMEEFSSEFLKSIKDLDGFILKNRSPSCGLNNIKIYPEVEGRPRRDGQGFFGGEVLKKFPHLAIEDEGRLRNLKIRENFLIKLFTLSRFREIKKNKKLSDLIDFQTCNKYLLMAYNPELVREMGRLIANQSNYSPGKLYSEYEEIFFKAMEKPIKITSNINVLMHALGHFSKKLNAEEKAFFLDALEKYRQGVMPLLVCLNILKAWIIRFNDDYLAQQTYFEPYPLELIPVTTIYQ